MKRLKDMKGFKALAALALVFLNHEVHEGHEDELSNTLVEELLPTGSSRYVFVSFVFKRS